MTRSADPITMNLRTTEELHLMLEGQQISLTELAPYNGTAPGATAISECLRQMDLIQAELDRRAGA